MQFWTWPEYNLEIFKTVNWSKQADRAAFQNRRYWENPDLDSVFHIHFTFEVQPVLRSSLATADNFPDRKPGSTMETCDGHGKLPVRDSSGKLIAPVCSVWAEVVEKLSEIRWAARRAAPAGRLLESRDDVRQRLEAGTQYSITQESSLSGSVCCSPLQEWLVSSISMLSANTSVGI